MQIYEFFLHKEMREYKKRRNISQIRYRTQDFTPCLMDFTSKSTDHSNNFLIAKLTIIELTVTLTIYIHTYIHIHTHIYFETLKFQGISESHTLLQINLRNGYPSSRLIPQCPRCELS